jgi:hypothetical protein
VAVAAISAHHVFGGEGLWILSGFLFTGSQQSSSLRRSSGVRTASRLAGAGGNPRGSGIHRRLAQDNPSRFAPDLAQSLNNLSLRLSDTGDGDGALAAIREAAEIYRRLAQRTRRALRPTLRGTSTTCRVV